MKSHLLNLALIALWLGGPVVLGYAALIMSSNHSRAEETQQSSQKDEVRA